MDIIRVELGCEVENRGTWDYRVPAFALEGRSRQPLLDACRRIKRMGGGTADQQVGLYRAGKPSWDMKCGLDWGATHTVDETYTRFAKWKAYPPRAG